MKTNAKDYLIEFARSQDSWLKALIHETIESNGTISNERKTEIYSCLKNSKAIEVDLSNISIPSANGEIHISKLTHKKGVNALAENQTIKFNNDITILFGMNGAGKSGYFRILNELVGGNQKKEILQNIYSNTLNNIDVEIVFEDNNNQVHTINWNGQTRSLPLLDRCKVFDTSYLNGLLDVRQSDLTLIQPLGLSLFTYLVDMVDSLKNQLISDADKLRLQKPTIVTTNFSEPFQNAFSNHSLSDVVKRAIEKHFIFTDENKKLLLGLKSDVDNLKQINIVDKVSLLENNKRDLILLKKNIEEKETKLSDFQKHLNPLLIQYQEKEKASLKTKEQFELLKVIPSNNSKEWKDFIIAGEKYSNIIGDSENTCIYCRQPLKDDSAINIVRSYSLFLKDSSEQELNRVNSEISGKINEIERYTTSIQISENIDKILIDTKVVDTNLKELILQTEQAYLVIKEQLIAYLKAKTNNNAIAIPNITLIKDQLNKLLDDLQMFIDKLTKEDSEKKEKIKTLEKQIADLQESESISIQKESIIKWFDLHSKEATLRKKASTINTRQLSTLSATAHEELLTESLKTKFNEELQNIGYSNIDVYLEGAGTKKGVSSTKLTLTKNKDLKAVLSEGEQKAVALALFIAEIRIQRTSNPIILDDPVNSLDHKIAGKFAERLMELDNQIILFNHNRLFLDSFETCKTNHICRTTDTDCNNSKGKHIKIYEVISQGKNVKGVLRNYKGNHAKNHIKDAKRLLSSIPFEDEIKVSNLLRLTVECVIDEVIFNYQVPTRFSNKNSRIAWAELKSINNDSVVIDTLERIHSRVSGGEMHNGTERNENPIEVDEYNSMILDLDNILQLKA